MRTAALVFAATAAVAGAMGPAPTAAQIGAPAGPAAGADRFTVDHAIDMPRVGSPAVSPDGRRVLYTVTELDWGDNKRDTRLWIANVDGSDARPFTAEEGDGSARWSPDGRWVAFTRAADEDGEDNGDGRQIWLIRTDGGEARQLTKHPTSVRGYEWTPDSRRLVFVAEDTLAKEEKEARKKGADAVFVNEGPNGQTRGSYSNLWWVPADFEDAEARPVTAGERMIGDFAVSPDGARVAFTFRTEDHRNDEFRSEIALVALGDGNEPGEIRQLTDNAAPESGLRWRPGTGELLFTAPSLERWELDQGNLYLMDVASGDVRQLVPETALEIRGGEFTPDGRYLDVTALERTVSNFYRIDLRNGRIRAMTEWAGGVGGASWSRDHDVVAFTFDTPTAPTELFTARFRRGMERTAVTDLHAGIRAMTEWVGGVGGASWSRDHGVVAFTFDTPTAPAELFTARYRPGMERTAVTDLHAGIRALTLSEPELVRWTSTDGTEIEGIYYPPVGGRTAPGAFVLEIHGGPAGVFTRGFDPDAQVLAAQGYAILQPNVRGSTGYGDALLRGNMNDIGGGDYQDVMTGVDAMVERGVAHEDSLAVKGWSYGGILGGWTITQTDRFEAASLGAMVSDWPGEFGVGFNFDVSLWYLGGDPWTNRELWMERSAYTHADQVSTPTILFHGEEDTTDTPGQSMNFHVALRHFDVPTRLILFPREPHGIREPRHHRTRLVEELRWFERYVRGNESWTAPERPADEDAGEEGGDETGGPDVAGG